MGKPVSEDNSVRGHDSSPQMQHLIREVERITEECVVAARRARRRGKFWNVTHLLFGLPAAVLAAIAGAAGLASAGGRIPAAILALCAASMSAALGFVRPEARQVSNLQRRYAWQDLERRARLVLAREAYMGPDDLYKALSRLLDLRNAVPSSAIVYLESVGPKPTSNPPATEPAVAEQAES